MTARGILYVDVSGRAGGSNSSLRAILAGLDRKRYRPTLVFGDRGHGARWDEEVYELNFAGLDNFDFFPAAWNIRWIYNFLRFIFHLPVDLFLAIVLLLRIKPAVLHVNVGQAVAFGIAGRIMGFPVVWHIRELVCRNVLGRLQDRLYAFCADRVVAPSRAVALRLPACATKTAVIPNSALAPSIGLEDLERFRKQHRINADDFVLLLLANSVTAGKGYLFLADVADRLEAETGIRFLLAGQIADQPARSLHRLFRRTYRTIHGGMSEKERIMERWKNHVIAGRAVFTGFVDPSLAIASCSVVVCPNQIAEPFGRSVIEAGIQSKPVIATNISAFDELITDNESGWLLPPSVEAWASLIATLHSDPSRLHGAGGATKLRASQFTPERHSGELMVLYDAVTGCE